MRIIILNHLNGDTEKALTSPDEIPHTHVDIGRVAALDYPDSLMVKILAPWKGEENHIKQVSPILL